MDVKDANDSKSSSPDRDENEIGRARYRLEANDADRATEEKLLSSFKQSQTKSPSFEAKFIGNFVPAESNREKRKQLKKKPSSLYDSKGIIHSINLDLCDCLDENCPGCYFPCVRCRSTKCGHECRQKRQYMYDSHEIMGTDIVVKNKFKHLVNNNN